jgi:hypothetical protein
LSKNNDRNTIYWSTWLVKWGIFGLKKESFFFVVGKDEHLIVSIDFILSKLYSFVFIKVAGGFGAHQRPVDIVERWNPRSNEWTALQVKRNYNKKKNRNIFLFNLAINKKTSICSCSSYWKTSLCRRWIRWKTTYEFSWMSWFITRKFDLATSCFINISTR